MKLNYSKKVLIISGLIFLGVLVLDIIFTAMLFGRVASINDKVRQIYLSAQERETNLNLKDVVRTSEKERAQLDQYFIAAGDAKTAEFINYLESLAKKTGLSYGIKSVGYEEIGDLGSSDVVYAIKFKFNVVGQWGNVFNFLQTIENLPKVLFVQGVSFDVGSGFDLGNNIKTKGRSWSLDVDFSVVKLKN